MWQYINMNDPYEYNPENQDVLRGTQEKNAELSYTNFGFIFGYTRIIGKEKKAAAKWDVGNKL